MKISVVIIAQNEAETISRSILSCKEFADEVLIVDGGSQDSTVAKAESLGCKVVLNPWPGYAKQRNFGADRAESDWIFILDADEAVDDTLSLALKHWKLNPPKEGVFAYRCKRIGNFFNTWLESTSDHPIRFYQKQHIQVREVVVHEGPDPGSHPVGVLPGTIWHYGFRSLHDHVRRFNQYTDLDAEKLYQQGRRYSHLKLVIRPVGRFVQKYILQRMYLKGIAGLSVALLWSYYEVLRELKLYELSLNAVERSAVNSDTLLENS